MIKNRNKVVDFMIVVFSRGYARSILISTSKIKNRRAIRKNWKEKGMWDGVIRLNPHSNFVHLLVEPASFFFTIRQDVAKMVKRSNAVLQIVTNFIIKVMSCL